jgi:uncharacterized MAPEG superfamily protein
MMPIEFTWLGLTLLLALVQLFAAAHVRTRDYGIAWNMGARDEAMPPPSPLAGRLLRAQANLMETLPLFAAALLAAAYAAHLGPLTRIGSALYFFGRLIYLPLYATGVPKLRSLVWGVAMLGLVLVIWALLFG